MSGRLGEDATCASLWCHIGRGVVLCLAIELIGGCAAPLDYPRTPSFAFDHPEETRLGRKFEARLAGHPEICGFHLLPQSTDSLSARLALIDAAEKTVEAQDYEFADDTAANLFAGRLLAAARRGVKVRLLVDDWNQTGKDKRLASLAAEENIEVRVFNPVGGPRAYPLDRPLSCIFARRLAQRMHNKALVADSAAAIVGGRNIADAYFAARDDFRFGDIDVLAIGPVARRIAAAFDEYWNDRLAVPIEAFVSKQRTAAHAGEMRQALEDRCAAAAASPYARELRQMKLPEELGTSQLPLAWGECEYLYDRPAKIGKKMEQDPSAYMEPKLRKIIEAVEREALVITPYFVPGHGGLEWIAQIRKRDVEIKVLTNSLASTDELAVHGEYARYREKLLRLGVDLYEARPQANRERSRGGSSGKSALHAKCIVLDRDVVFIGSFNIDPRSARLNTEDGLVIRSVELVEQSSELFIRRRSPKFAYKVTLRTGSDGREHGLVWTAQDDDTPLTYSQEPETNALRRLAAWFLATLLPERWI